MQYDGTTVPSDENWRDNALSWHGGFPKVWNPGSFSTKLPFYFKHPLSPSHTWSTPSPDLNLTETSRSSCHSLTFPAGVYTSLQHVWVHCEFERRESAFNVTHWMKILPMSFDTTPPRPRRDSWLLHTCFFFPSFKYGFGPNDHCECGLTAGELDGKKKKDKYMFDCLELSFVPSTKLTSVPIQLHRVNNEK